MKSLCCVAALVVCTSMSFSQIPNSGFENWVTDLDGNYNPVGWETTNSFPTVSVDTVSPGHGGAFAIRVRSIDLSVAILPGVAFVEAQYAFSQTPAKFSAWVKATIMPGDTAFIIMALMKGDTVIAATDSCTFKIGSSYSQYEYFEFPIAVLSDKIPDSLYIMVATSLTGNPQAGTELIVDDIAFIFNNPTGVSREPILPDLFRLAQNYPNPFNPSTKIVFDLPEGGMTTLIVYDLLGREIATLVSGVLTAGTHTRLFNADHLPSGMYVYQLRSGTLQATRKLTLMK